MLGWDVSTKPTHTCSVWTVTKIGISPSAAADRTLAKTRQDKKT